MIAPPDPPARIADRAVAFVERKFGIVLPYNPPSLLLVDAIVDKIKATGSGDEAVELFHILNPVNQTRTAAGAERLQG